MSGTNPVASFQLISKSFSGKLQQFLQNLQPYNHTRTREGGREGGRPTRLQRFEKTLCILGKEVKFWAKEVSILGKEVNFISTSLKFAMKLSIFRRTIDSLYFFRPTQIT